MKQINKVTFIALTCLYLALNAGYYYDAFSGNRTVHLAAIMSVIIIISTITNILVLKKNPEWEGFKYVSIIGFLTLCTVMMFMGKNDYVFHLGDFSVGGAAEWTSLLDCLNGRIFLVLGNHDMNNVDQGFMRRFEDVSMQMLISIGKQRVYLT